VLNVENSGLFWNCFVRNSYKMMENVKNVLDRLNFSRKVNEEEGKELVELAP